MSETTPRKLSAVNLGAQCTFRHRALAVSGILMAVDPEVATEHDGAGTESNVLVGPIALTLSDGWGITVTAHLPPDHPITIQENL